MTAEDVAVVGEIKKGRYIYYHCTGHKQKCPDAYVREEVLTRKFGDILRRLVFDEGVLQCVRSVIHAS